MELILLIYSSNFEEHGIFLEGQRQQCAYTRKRAKIKKKNYPQTGNLKQTLQTLTHQIRTSDWGRGRSGSYLYVPFFF